MGGKGGNNLREFAEFAAKKAGCREQGEK